MTEKEKEIEIGIGIGIGTGIGRPTNVEIDRENVIMMREASLERGRGTKKTETADVIKTRSDQLILLERTQSELATGEITTGSIEIEETIDLETHVTVTTGKVIVIVDVITETVTVNVTVPVNLSGALKQHQGRPFQTVPASALEGIENANENESALRSELDVVIRIGQRIVLAQRRWMTANEEAGAPAWMKMPGTLPVGMFCPRQRLADGTQAPIWTPWLVGSTTTGEAVCQR